MTTVLVDDDSRYVLQYGPAATSSIKSVLHLNVRPHLHDVRAMLRLPLPEAGITAGCNFAPVHVLLNVTSGLSRLMGPSPKRSEQAFKTFVARWYPWRSEPRGSFFRQKRGTDVLYGQFRNGFSHDLGLMLDRSAVDTRGLITARFRIGGRQLGVAKQPSLSPVLLNELDDVSRRPHWLGPTVERDGRKGLLVDAVALYWGVRRLVFDHTSSQRAVKPLRVMIEEARQRQRDAGHIDTIECLESGVLLFNGKPTTVFALQRRLRSRGGRRPDSQT
jgi:hypothetical protein